MTLAQQALTSKNFQPTNAIAVQAFPRSTIYTFGDGSSLTVNMYNTMMPAYAE